MFASYLPSYPDPDPDPTVLTCSFSRYRWVEAGKPPAAYYALVVTDAEFRAFRRAVNVVAGANSQHLRKRSRVEEPVDQETAAQLMKDLASVHTDTGKQQMPPGYLPAAVQKLSSNPVRCFEFKHICGFQLQQRVAATAVAAH